MRHPSILALEWVPLVAAADRAQVEAQARAEGIDDFRITEIGPDGEIVTAGERPEYCPVLFAVPVVRNRAGVRKGATPRPA